MLFLLFRIGKDRYGLEISRIVEVLPALPLKKLPRAERGVAGILDYHGELVPVLDLSELCGGQCSPDILSTRIVLVRYPLDSERSHILGLRAERATETVRLEANSFQDGGIELPGAPYLGPVARDAEGLIQRVEVEGLLSKELRALLFRGWEAAA
ncbi:MAG TPA: chemotaxis protein CheW [Luteolibacter sp.]